MSIGLAVIGIGYRRPSLARKALATLALRLSPAVLSAGPGVLVGAGYWVGDFVLRLVTAAWHGYTSPLNRGAGGLRYSLSASLPGSGSVGLIALNATRRKFRPGCKPPDLTYNQGWPS